MAKKRKKENWIAEATEHKGGFRKKAHEAGEDTEDYAEQVVKPGITRSRAKASAKTKRQAQLALTLKKLQPKKKKKGGA